MKDDNDNNETVLPLTDPHMKKLEIYVKVVKELEQTLKKIIGSRVESMFMEVGEHQLLCRS
jgi:hypothetical protein